NGAAKVFELQGKDLIVIGWKTTEAGVRAVVVTNRWKLFDKNEVSELYLADPTTGTLERQQNVAARFEIDNPLSPDGKRRFLFGKDERIVSDDKDGKERRLVFHEDDRRFVGPDCIEWVSPTYLKFNGPRLALIDVTTMKMCFPPSADGTRFDS